VHYREAPAGGARATLSSGKRSAAGALLSVALDKEQFLDFVAALQAVEQLHAAANDNENDDDDDDNDDDNNGDNVGGDERRSAGDAVSDSALLLLGGVDPGGELGPTMLHGAALKRVVAVCSGAGLGAAAGAAGDGGATTYVHCFSLSADLRAKHVVHRVLPAGAAPAGGDRDRAGGGEQLAQQPWARAGETAVLCRVAAVNARLEEATMRIVAKVGRGGGR
jgi:hypothetical protein